MSGTVVFLHALNNRPVTYHAGLAKDRVVESRGVVTLIRGNEKIVVKESMKEIRKIVREQNSM